MRRYWDWIRRGVICIVLVGAIAFASQPAAQAGLEDDRYDGNIFALYAGNGSLVPPRMDFATSLRQNRPVVAFYYVDDSRDCKTYSIVLSQLQAPYGRAASFVPIMADSIPVKDSYAANEPGRYFRGAVPQLMVFDEAGAVQFDKTGAVTYEEVDDVLREVFDLYPRSESVELRRRPVNEVSVELVPEQRDTAAD